jgi:hypothetical protein
MKLCSVQAALAWLFPAIATALMYSTDEAAVLIEICDPCW